MFKKLFGASTEQAKTEVAKPAAAPRPSATALQINQIAAEETAVVFKHSSTCPVSWMADRQMEAFRAEHPEVPFYKVIVQDQRALSNELASWTGIGHESPQIIVLRRGKVVADLSHSDVTAELVAEAAGV